MGAEMKHNPDADFSVSAFLSALAFFGLFFVLLAVGGLIG